MDHPAVADVEADVAEPVEEDEVAGLQVAAVDRPAVGVLSGGVVRQPDPEPSRRRRRRDRSSRTRSVSCRRSDTGTPSSAAAIRTARWPSVGALGFGRGSGLQRHRLTDVAPDSGRSGARAASPPRALATGTRSTQSASRQMRVERAMEKVTGTQHGRLKRPAASQ